MTSDRAIVAARYGRHEQGVNMREVRDWLRDLGLEQYSRMFSEHAIDADTLPELKDGDLQGLGIPLGHRKRILKAIGQLARKAEGSTQEQWRSERRFLTILFVDIVESTSFAQRLDPEDLAGLLNAFHETSSRIVERFGGFVARNLGDGLAAYFGWPESREHDAERAVLTGFELIDAVKAIPTTTADRIQLHVAVATGQVVVGDVLRMDSERVHEVFGELPNLAARLQALSPPDTILVSEETHRLIRHRFVCAHMGRKKLKGFQDPVPVSRVVGQRALSLNFEARRDSGLTPLIGRAAEIELLKSRWERAAAGDGRVVLIAGEAGIGKSRLCAELLSSLGGTDFLELSFQCSPLHQDNPLYPVARAVAQIAGLSDADSVEAKRQKLQALFGTMSDDHDAGTSMLAAYLGISGVGDDEPASLSPERQRMELHRLLADFVLTSARRRPVLAVFEDVHWMDPTTNEFLDTLIRHVPAGAILVVVTFRPAFQPPWQENEHRTLLNLHRLTRDQSAQFIDKSKKTGELPRAVVAEIIDRSDGIPLYIEELTAAVLSQRRIAVGKPVAGSSAGGIPSTLQESLLARIDRTSRHARELMQLCAVVGRRFSYEQISIIADASVRQRDEALAELTDHGLLQATGTPPHADYLFKHALLQDAAYSIILRQKRQRLHAQCAVALEKHFPSVCANDPGALGLHHEIAGNASAAIPYFLAAGQLALERSALKEAETSIQRGLSLLESLPENEWRNQHELKLRSMLGRVCIFAKGWADPSVKLEYGRALELSEALGMGKEQVPLEWALTTYHLLRGEIREAMIGGQRVLELAEQERDTDLLHVAHSALTIYGFYGGTFVDAIQHMEQALRFHRPEASEELRRHFGTDRRLQAMRGAALSHWCLGDHQRALDLDEAQRSLAMSGDRPFEYAYALTISCILHALRRDGQKTYSFATDAIEIAQDQGFSFLEANAVNFRAIGSALQQPCEATLGECDDAIEAYQLAGNRMGMSSMLAIMAELCGRVGLHERALRYIDKALIYVRRSGEGFAQSDLYRVKGQLLAAVNRTSDAKYWLYRAILLAQKQHARTWELEAAIRLAQILSEQSEIEKAYGLLQTVCHKLHTSGFVSDQLSRAQEICAQWRASGRLTDTVAGEPAVLV